MLLPTLKLLEYLCYLCVFILLLKYSDASPVEEITISQSFSPTNNVEVANTAAPSSTSTAASTSGSFSKRDVMKRAFEDCESGLSWMCLKMEFVKLMERLGEREELNILPGVSVVKDINATKVKAADLMAEVARNYPNEPSTRLNGYIITKFSNFLQTHYLRFKLIDTNTVAEARSAVATGRKGKFGKKGGLEALIAAGLMMKGTLMAVGMGAIALMAGKALMTALMALTLSGVLGLKTLASGGGKSTTYEIVAKPVYTSSHTHSTSGMDAGHGYGGSAGGHSGSGGYSGGYKRSLRIDVPEKILASTLNSQ